MTRIPEFKEAVEDDISLSLQSLAFYWSYTNGLVALTVEQ
jgi:hypothetical protein